MSSGGPFGWHSVWSVTVQVTAVWGQGLLPYGFHEKVRMAEDSRRPPSMAERQGATPPSWLGRSRWRLLLDAIGGWRENIDKIVQLAGLVAAFLWPPIVRRRLERLRSLGHIEVTPSMPQLLIASRDQIAVSASEETKIFYRSQGIPWIFHNLRRFLAGPATMMDPVGFFSPRETIIHHVLQTFHRHPVYDLVLLRSHDSGVEELEAQTKQILAGTHPHQAALTSLIEDGSYHARLPREIAAFQADPHVPARPIPPGLVDDALMMLGMDQFKDVAGYTRYAARLRVGWWEAVMAWLRVGFDETLGGLLGVKLVGQGISLQACDADLVARHLPGGDPAVTVGATAPPAA